ncbi:pentatricopeptide repeat-containing protein At4g13650 isoform X1 [Asparagus officinalis]|uniref:pentatricopeptide repeat-containing protein At4g13650 isoform X1 n=1 Tax=Asparagus officinalis TaxID=4686 RepID=UPI00098DE3D1|nr:pentatricopeptide repeat-containing protein At4g13650 isoform X1 [Asparagus officinalis]
MPSISLVPLTIPSSNSSHPHFRASKALPISKFLQFKTPFPTIEHPFSLLIRHHLTFVCRFSYSNGESEGNPVARITQNDAFSILYSMEESGVSPDHNTYAYLLDCCLSSGSLVDAKRIHARILKVGFGKDSTLCNKLIDFYLGFGDFLDAINVFEEMSHRTVSSWTSIISGFLERNERHQVLAIFPKMLRECRDPNPVAFASALRACSGNNVYWHLVQQIHAKIFRHGFVGDPIVGNPLIDLYSKNECIDSAMLVFEELFSKDNVSWVAMVSGFSQNEESLNVYCQMHQSGILPTPYVLSSVLSACAKCELFENGKQIHAQVHKWGFYSETFVGNALISLYSRCGALHLAHRVFTEMPRHDGVTYNSMISGLAQHGNSESALKIFEEMQHSSFKLDSVTISSLLSACAAIGDIEKGKQLHSYVLKAGLSSHYIIEGSILDLYVKCADVETARNFFNTTDKENVVLWNVMLVAYGQAGNLTESFDLFYQMQVKGLEPNQYTYPSILRTCTYLGELDLGEQIHTLAIKTRFNTNVYVSSVLIDMYSKCGRLSSAKQILERITEKDVVSWTAMIAGYAQHEFYIEALKTFGEMLAHGIQSDNIGLASAISACAGIKAIKQGAQIHAQACVSGYASDNSIGNSLINLYARCGKISEAYSAFQTVEPEDEISWNGLISGFAQSGHCEEALKVFVDMDRTGIKANLFTFGSAVSASGNMADIKQGKQIHAKMIKTGYDSDIEAGNVLVSLYSKCGSLDDAKMEFYGMTERNAISWNAMITGYSQHGHGYRALELFEQMKKKGFKPNHVTFVGVLAACSHVGLVNRGLDYFNSMSEEHGLIPKPEHYVCIVDILGRAGLLNRAKEFIEDMPVDPDAMIWRTLLSACTVHKNVEIGEFAAQHLLELEPHDSATYVLLSNIYAINKKWDCRDQIRKMMKDKKVKKEPGRSWIEVKNEVHAFYVGDRLHPLADKIYEYLEDLNNRAVEIGYKQDKYRLLNELEQEQKDPSAYIHSEKIAVSFGLISLSSEVPIRVIKNLRICNDCHTWMKLVSNIKGRVIIVRDVYRFHHFEEGSCSCGDYW